jgi:transcription termination factor Rho
MSVLDRAALEDSPLADLHAIASELSIDGYRRLRREQLIEAILDRQEGAAPGAPDLAEEIDDAKPRRRRGRRGGRPRSDRVEPVGAEAEGEEEEVEAEAGEQEDAEEALVEGVIELLQNGSAFLRVAPPEPSDEDVYISAAQVKRCELISGDRVSGPRRPARRSERFASLQRIDTVNGRPAAELADGARFEDLPAAFPREQLRFAADDPTLEEIDRLLPIGKGSRVTIVGGPGSGKSELLRRLAAALSREQHIQLFVVLSGVRPEELGEWRSAEPVQAASLATPPEGQAQTVTMALDQAKRIAARGGDAVVLLDTLVGLPPHAARRALAGARNIADGGSLTVIATASAPIGGETTLIVLDRALAGLGRFPAIDLLSSGVWRPELLLGTEGAAEIVSAREKASGG